MQLNLKNNQKHVFVGIDKKEYHVINEYFQARKIIFKTEDENAKRMKDDFSSDDDSSDVNKTFSLVSLTFCLL